MRNEACLDLISALKAATVKLARMAEVASTRLEVTSCCLVGMLSTGCHTLGLALCTNVMIC